MKGPPIRPANASPGETAYCFIFYPVAWWCIIAGSFFGC